MEPSMTDPRKGRAIIDVSVDILALAVALFPSTYRVVGSQDSECADTVRLIVESDDIAEGATVHITCEVKDAGSTRTVRMIPVGGNG